MAGAGLPYHRCLLIFICLCFANLAGASSNTTRLFENDETLQITLTAPFGNLGKERDKSQRYPASLRVADSAFDLELQVRGNYRLKKDTCRYPPLRLRMKKGAVKNTVFAGEKKLKLVTQCDKAAAYIDYLRSEFLAYKLVNLFTELSFRVRWVEVTYIDPVQPDDNVTRPAFLIEDKDRLAKRLDMNMVEHHRVDPGELDNNQSAMVALLQFLIGNTDYSLLQGEGKGETAEACCHNAKLLARNHQAPYFPVAYDFDNTGLVDPRYAQPTPGLKNTSVRQRVYRGYCEQIGSLEENYNLAVTLKPRLNTLYADDPILTDRAKQKAARFLASFYKLIDDPKKRQKKINDRCR